MQYLRTIDGARIPEHSIAIICPRIPAAQRDRYDGTDIKVDFHRVYTIDQKRDNARTGDNYYFTVSATEVARFLKACELRAKS